MSGRQTLSSIDKTVSQIDVLPSLRIATPVSGEAGQKYFFKLTIHGKLHPPLTDLDMHDQFC